MLSPRWAILNLNNDNRRKIFNAVVLKIRLSPALNGCSEATHQRKAQPYVRPYRVTHP